MSLGNPHEPYLEQLIEMLVKKQPANREQLKETLIKQQEAKIKEIKPEKDLDFYSWDSNSVADPLPDEPHEEMRHHLKLWYLLAVLKKTGISVDQVGDNMGLTFLGNVIHQFKRHQQLSCYPGSCNYVCFLYNYFQKVSTRDWPAKNAILGKLTKRLPKMVQTRNKAEKSFNEWWREEMLKQIIYYRYPGSRH